MNETRQVIPETQALATLVHLSKRARDARNVAELGFILVNESHALFPYQQAALWLPGRGVSLLSGVATPEANAPYVLWLKNIFENYLTSKEDTSAELLHAQNLPEEIVSEWQQWLPESAIILPLVVNDDENALGALLLARHQQWHEYEITLLQEWTENWSQSYRLKKSGTAWSGKWLGFKGLKYRSLYFFLAVLLALFLIPVNLTVLAPAELVPLKPSLIRSPLDGVIDSFHVVPNQLVKQGDALFEFDRVNIENRLQIATQALATAKTEYRQKSQQALLDPSNKSKLAVLQGQISEKLSEVSFLQQLSERGFVTAPRNGIALFDDPLEWIGRPVVTGEKVMLVADEHAVEIEAWLSPADTIPLSENALLTFYLNADPFDPLQARVHYVAYEAVQRPDGLYAYRVRASLDNSERQPRVGLKGTAKLSGEKVSLIYWMLRRPLAAIRAWLGL
jgi:hypothetical protein